MSASQEFGMINRTDTGINIHHDIRNEIGYKRVLPGQFVIHLRSFQGGFAHSAVEGITSPAYTVLDFQEQENHYDYFWKYIFNSEEFIRRLELITYGIRDGRSISFEDFTTLDFYFPSCEEQKQIGKYFQEIDNLITLHRRKPCFIILLFENHNEVVPYDWEQRKLGELLYLLKDGTHGTHQDVEDGPLLLSAKNIKNGHINWDSSDRRISESEYEKIHSNFTLEKEDILLTIVGSIGETAILKDNYRLTFQRSVAYLRPKSDIKSEFLYSEIQSPRFQKELMNRKSTSAQPGIYLGDLSVIPVSYPKNLEEQKQIGRVFGNLDNLITLHQRKPFCPKEEEIMQNQMNNQSKFCDYYAKWIDVYKKGAVRKVTMSKYLMTHKWITKLIPNLRIEELDRIMYQQLLNEYAECHEKQTVMDFHHHLKGAILDAVDEGLIDRDPTRKAIIKGKVPRVKKVKYLNQFQLQTLISSLHLKEKISWDYLILLVAKTGMRFSEALALTPDDFDLRNQTIIVCKTWDYKGNGGFMPTKNRSSNRKIQIDWQTVIRFSELIKNLPQDQPIFVDGKVYNSTINDILGRMCKKNNLPIISVHGLRHTHASLLLFTGVSTASVARRLGHSSINTTQRTYLHIIQELENKDVDLVMRSLAAL